MQITSIPFKDRLVDDALKVELFCTDLIERSGIFNRKKIFFILIHVSMGIYFKYSETLQMCFQ